MLTYAVLLERCTSPVRQRSDRYKYGCARRLDYLIRDQCGDLYVFVCVGKGGVYACDHCVRCLYISISAVSVSAPHQTALVT